MLTKMKQMHEAMEASTQYDVHQQRDAKDRHNSISIIRLLKIKHARRTALIAATKEVIIPRLKMLCQ